MKLKRDDLRQALRLVAYVRPAGREFPLLEYVLLQARAGEFSLRATDQETVITHGDVDHPTVVSLVPPKRLLAILGELTGETVELLKRKSQLLVSDEASQFELAVPDVAGFPRHNAPDAGRWYVVAAAELKAALRLTLFAVAESSGRYAIEGVLLDFRDADTLVLVTTDSRRLAVAPVECECAGEPDRDVQAVLPLQTGMLLQRLLPDDGTCRFAFGLTGGIVFEFGPVRVVSRLLEGAFPRWRSVLLDSGGTDTPISFVSGDVASVLRQAAITTSEESNAVDVSISESGIFAASHASDVGRSQITRALPFDHSAEFRVCPGHLLEMLTAVGPDQELTLDYIDSEAPLLFSRDDGYRFLQMPLGKE